MASKLQDHTLFFFLTILFSSLAILSLAQSCKTHHFFGDKTFAACTDLPVLDSSIHWNYHQSSNTVNLAFKKSNVKQSTWIAWAINPTLKGMVGSQALVALQKSDGFVSAYTSQVARYDTTLKEGNLSFPVLDISAEYDNGEMVIFATIELPGNSTMVNHLWQEGSVSDGIPRMHALSGPNVLSFGSLDFLSGKIAETKGKIDKNKLKIAHGVLNAVSWGTLMPIGAIVARYVKVFDGADPAWFYIHVTCQCVALLVGLVGFSTGIYLGALSPGIQHTPHRCIGITLVCLGIAQVLVGRFLRPKKDHKYRIYWNTFHYTIGYGTIILSIVNVLKGFYLLKELKEWKHGYVGVIIGLGCLAFLLEIGSWYPVRKRKASQSMQKEAGADA